MLFPSYQKEAQNGTNFGNCQKSVSRLLSYGMETFDIDQIIGQNLRRLREARRLSQGDLAEKISVKPSRISAIEHGREGMGKYLMTRICRALGVHPNVFYQNTTVTETTGVDAQEQNVLNMLREARELGIIGKVQEYAEYLIEKSEQEEKTHLKKKAG